MKLVSEKTLSWTIEIFLIDLLKNKGFIICNRHIKQVKFAGYETAT